MRPKHMYVTSVDRDGDEVEEGTWVEIPEPEHFAANGFREIPAYLSRVLESTSSVAALIISTTDRSRAFLVIRRDGQPALSFCVNWRTEPEMERALRDTFERLGTAPIEDYLAGNGSVVDATRVLTYPVSRDFTVLAALCEDILQGIFGIPPTAGLGFLYQTLQA
jgi:hypothetical protein